MFFDLEKAISAWRRPYEINPAFLAEDVDELEGSLRDRVEALMDKGLSEKEAFHSAAKRTGTYGAAEAEYRKVYWGKLKHQHRLGRELLWRVSLLKNYVTIALRMLRKHKGYAFINIFGLAIGLTCFLLISLIVQFELSYDRFHENADRIYRIAKENPASYYLGSNRWTVTPEPLAGALMDEFPEVEHAAQIVKATSLLEYNDRRFYEDGIYATEHFFQVFSFPLLQGDPRTALVDPQSIILTESLARKYFGDADPMGQTLTVTHSGEHFTGENEMIVTAIVEDVPANSHFSFDFLIPPSSSQELSQWFGHWDSNSYLTYVSLHPDHSQPAFAAKLSTLAEKHLSQVAYYQEHPDKIGTYYPQALTDIHLRSHLNGEFSTNGDIKYVYLFSGIALLILLIACINYINLATARSTTRAKEVGVRKVMGAHRGQLIGQFMSEAIMPSVLALLIAVLLVALLLPTFNALTGRSMVLDLAQQGGLLATLLLVGLGVGILAGSFPSFSLSSFHPVRMMKGRLQQNGSKTTLRNVLVIVQFTITIVLMVGTIVIQRQLHFIQNETTGLNRDQIIMIEVEDQTLYDDRYAALKQTLQRHPNVLGVTAAQANPTDIGAASRASAWEGAEEGQSLMVYRSIIQHGYLDLFGLELVEGRDFSEAIASDSREGMLINETLKQQLGWDSAVGKWFNFHGREARITGVVKDFNFHSFHHDIAPLALFLDSGWWFPFQRIFVKVSPDGMQETIAFLEESMAAFSPSYPFDYTFMDDAYNRMYQTETRLGSLLSYFTFLALFLACLGLLGLAAFMAQQRTKEIGVRKVLGATLSDILVLLSKDFTRLVVIAFILAAPMAYFAQSQWLQAFAHRISVGWGTFMLAGGAVLLIAWLTVSYQTIRAAQANPVKSLRYE